MRLVHTSDWHAGRIWKTLSRLDELEAVLSGLACYVEQEKVDFLLMSGDVFDTGAPSALAERLVFRFLRRVGDAGTQSIVIAGNHDSAARLDAWGLLAELVNVHTRGRVRQAQDGGVIKLRSRDQEQLIVAAVPWASVGEIVSALEMADDPTIAHQRYAEWMKRITQHLSAEFSADAVNVLMAHTHLEGAIFGGSERKVHIGDDWAATAQMLPANAHYIALGHIHKPQSIASAPSPTYYAGSPLQLDFGEAHEEKSFVVIDAAPRTPAMIRRIPYQGGKSLHKLTASLEELERQADSLKTEGWLSVTVPLNQPDPDIGGKVRRLLPNAISVDFEPLWEDAPPPTASRAGMSPSELFRAYCVREQGHEPDARLLEAFAQLHEQAGRTLE